VFGTAVTLVFVDRLLYWREEADKRIRAKGAMFRMKKATEGVLEAFGWAILGVQQKAPPNVIQSIEGLIADSMTDELSALNPHEHSIGTRIASGCIRFLSVGEGILDIYGSYLPTEYVAAFDEIAASDFLPYVQAMYGHPDEPEGTASAIKFMASAMVKTKRREFFSSLHKFIICHNHYADSEQQVQLPLLFQKFIEYPGPYRYNQSPG
jgi:hypothetical protein